MYKLILSSIIFILISNVSQAKPISLKGLSMDLSPREQAEILFKNHSCTNFSETFNRPFWECTELVMDEIKGNTVTDKIVYVGGGVEPSVRFNCDNFNVCGRDLDEVAQMIVDQGIISDLDDYDIEVSPHNGWVTKSYCGRGPDGDVLCVSDTNDFRSVEIELLKGIMGKSAPSFN